MATTFEPIRPVPPITTIFMFDLPWQVANVKSTPPVCHARVRRWVSDTDRSVTLQKTKATITGLFDAASQGFVIVMRLHQNETAFAG
jgi:hypothetical protein